MGIIASLLFSAGLLGKTFYIPLTVVLLCYAAIALGTMFGGWRIVKTMGQKVAKLKPVDGFCAESSAALGIADFNRLWHSGQHHAHYHRSDYGSGVAAAAQRRPLGCGRPDSLGMDINHSGFRSDSSDDLQISRTVLLNFP